MHVANRQRSSAQVAAIRLELYVRGYGSHTWIDQSFHLVNMTRSVQLWLLIHGSWRSILTIPVSDIHLFTTRPLGWLMFLGYTIYGRQGTLQADPEGPELDDYTINVGSLSDHYYYVAQGNSNLLVVTEILYLCG
jgi:hypothetical protein